MTSPIRQPDPQDWIRAYAQVQVASDQQIVAILADAADSLKAEIARVVSKANQTVSDTIRYQQMSIIRRALLEEQARVLRAVGRVVEARRLDAVARAIQLGNGMDAFLLDRIGRTALAREVLTGLTTGLARTTEVALARMGLSYTELSQRIYNTDVWLGSRIDQRITSLLAQGKTAREFAAEAVNWFNPNTPGGVRYASMRLARSEINNAFHAVAVQQVQDKPWVNSMQWHLSGSHPKADICDEYAGEDKYDKGRGVFPKADVPRKPHPHCFCYVTPVQIDEDEFLDRLVNGDYDRWIADQRRLAEQRPPVVPTARPVAAGTRRRTAPPPQATQPTPATRGLGATGPLSAQQLANAKRMYGDFTRDVRLLDGMRVPDLKALARTYGLVGAGSQTRPVLLRRLKAKFSAGGARPVR